MLLILYGATADMGAKSRSYLVGAGFPLVEKYNYAEQPPKVTTLYGKRNFVSREEFYEKTDSLFRYEVGGILVGFHYQQISDAVCGRANALLTLSAADVSLLQRIKQVYGDQVRLIYAYIDENTLRDIVWQLDIDEREKETRVEIGRQLKRSYVTHAGLFDHVVVYGGQGTVCDDEALFAQYDAIIERLPLVKRKEQPNAEVYLSFARADRPIAAQVTQSLTEAGIVFRYAGDMQAGTNFKDACDAAIERAKIAVLFLSQYTVSGSYQLAEIKHAMEIARSSGALLIPFWIGTPTWENDPTLDELALLPAVHATEGRVEAAVAALTERISLLQNTEAELRILSDQVDNYLQLSMRERAIEVQEKHLARCDEVYELSRGEAIRIDVLVSSRVRLAGMLMDMQQYERALDVMIDALNLETSDDEALSGAREMAEEQFILCCHMLGMSGTAVEKLIRTELLEAGLLHGDRFAQALLEAYVAYTRAEEAAATGEVGVAVSETDRIAETGESIMAMFAALLEKESNGADRADLRLGYERVLNFCKFVGVGGQVAETCIRRIAELSATAAPATQKGSELGIWTRFHDLSKVNMTGCRQEFYYSFRTFRCSSPGDSILESLCHIF